MLFNVFCLVTNANKCQLMQFNGTDGNHRNFTFSIVMYMSTSDTAEFQIWRTSGQSWSLYNGQFNIGGFLIG